VHLVALFRFINNPNTLKLDGFRSIKSVTLGPYWIPAPPHNTFSIMQQAFNYRRGEPTIMLVSRTQPLAANDAEAFRDVRANGTHDITDREWKELVPVLGEQADHDLFTLKVSEVMDWNGKLVIHNEGEYVDFQLRTFSLFVDADDSGQFVEEIIYQAPRGSYEAYLNEAMLGLQSIEWHSLHSFLK